MTEKVLFRQMSFKDHFSKQAGAYAQYRPTYPGALFKFLASLVDEKKQAWDCATGNGQAARALADFFEKVIATDASAKQIAHAFQHPKIQYAVAPAEKTGIQAKSCDLITVAQALHWFDFDRFFAECTRVLKPKGILAIWGYNLLSIEPELDKIIDDFYFNIVGIFWPPERRWLEKEYGGISFPFTPIATPHFTMSANWDLYELCGYLNTWSAVTLFIKQNGMNPVDELAAKLKLVWRNANVKKKVKWPLFLKVGKFTL